MKTKFIKILAVLALACITGIAVAQPPAGIPYQFVAKDNIGNPARNRTVYVQCAIIQTAAVGGTTVLE